MSAADGMTIWTGDYLADTQHLSCFEHGAYMLILMAMWRNGGTLPNDEVRLAKITKNSLAIWRKHSAAVMELFDIDDAGKLSQKRLSKELQRTLSRIEKRREAGQLGNEAKSLKNKDRTLANGSANGIANAPDLRAQKASGCAGDLDLDSDIRKTLVSSGDETRESHEKEPTKEPKVDLEAKFEEFWKAYPDREGTDSKKAAKEKFLSLCKRDKDPCDPDQIILGTKGYAAEIRKTGRERTRFVKHAKAFLYQEHFRDFVAKAAAVKANPSVVPKNGDILDACHTSLAEHYGKFYFHQDSPQFKAWEDHFNRQGKRSLPRFLHRGWGFSEPWPPGHVPKQIDPSQTSSGGGGGSVSPGVMQLKLVTNEGKVADGFNQ
jgi:uncharacterized protein YdaU (DUF1376 family)